MSKRTYAVVLRQLDAMAVSTFDIGLKSKDGRMTDRVWPKETVLKSLAWLARCNAGGDAIYIRPTGSRGLILIDDLSVMAVKRLTDEGLEPSLVVETSPQNFQVWLNFGISLDPE